MCADRDLCSKRGSPGVSGSGGTRADSAGVRRRSAAPPHGPDRSRRGRPARDPSLELGIGAASGRESGSGSVLVVGAIAALVVVLLGMMALVAAAVAAQRVRTAADLAAIAGAGAAAGMLSASAGAGNPCTVAASVATANGGELRACELQGDAEVLVEIAVPVSLPWPGAPSVATPSARAGPAPE